MTKYRGVLIGAMFALGLALGVGRAVAGEKTDALEPNKTDDKPKSEKKKARSGEKCKSNSDCDQDMPMSCIKGKCRADVAPPVT